MTSKRIQSKDDEQNDSEQGCRANISRARMTRKEEAKHG